MNIKKEYEKFFKRKKNDLCVHDAEDVIAFAKHYQSLQLLQTGLSKSFYCDEEKNIGIPTNCKEQCSCCRCK